MKYSDIYDIVAKYYPIGIDKRDPCYSLYSGSKLLELKIAEMRNSDENIGKWTELIDGIKFPEILKSNIISSSLDVCYSVEFLINQQTIESFNYTRKVICRISYLAPFFCIYGKEEISLTEGNQVINFDPLIIISPAHSFEKYFVILRQQIEKKYPEFRFLPFLWLEKRIANLQIVSSDLKEFQFSSVFQALFARENLTDFKLLGNKLYD